VNQFFTYSFSAWLNWSNRLLSAAENIPAARAASPLSSAFARVDAVSRSSCDLRSGVVSARL
jgi:hypothetical protein